MKLTFNGLKNDSVP